MSDANKVVWSEGLCLRPQHLQQQDRHIEALVRGAMLAASHQNYGFRHLSLDEAAIQAGQVGLTTAQGIFPDGTSFTLPDMTTGLKAVAVTASTNAGLVMLGIPAMQAGTSTTPPRLRLHDLPHVCSCPTRQPMAIAAFRSQGSTVCMPMGLLLLMQRSFRPLW